MIAWLAAGALAATCPGTGDPDAPFQRRPVAERVLVVVELWAHGAPAGWTEAALDAMDARGLPAMVVVPAGEPDPALLPLLDRVSRSPHELALLVPGALVPRDGQGSVGPVRDAVRAVEKVSEPAKTVLAPIGSRITEALLVRAGFRTLVDLAGPATATGRLAGHFEGQAPVDVVLPGGPYDDACGPDPRSAPFLPSAGDRAADAIARADAAPGVPVVRVALDGSGAGPDDARVLGRWLDEVLLPSGARVVTAEEARVRLLAAMRNPGSVQPPSPTAGARRVDAAALRAAAGELRGATALPRTLPSDLSLTELFAGLVLLEAGETEADVVRLRGLAGPVSPATTTLGGEVTVDRRALHDLAVSLVASWPHEVPSALPVGGRLLTASELLVALASAAVGDDPVVTRPVDPPDPNQRGLGWGSSTLP